MPTSLALGRTQPAVFGSRRLCHGLLLVLCCACGARTSLGGEGTSPCENCDGGVDVVIDHVHDAPIDVSIDVPPPSICGNDIVEPGEECDLGKDNGDKPAFLVTQPSGTNIETNMLVMSESSATFYDYFSASSHTGFEQTGESRLYLYADATSGRLSLILTHGMDNAQPSAAVNMDISGLPSGWSVDLSDDPGEFVQTGPSTASGKWTFNNNSDGGILGGLPFPGTWIITVTADFKKGITSWGWVKSDLSRVPLTLPDTVTIQAFDESSFCRTDCTIPRCGDGRLDGGEVCDDGNNVDGDGCAANCKSFN